MMLKSKIFDGITQNEFIRSIGSLMGDVGNQVLNSLYHVKL